jgi:NAD(P)-dependent dehydrogenase (short-subunit alcohol dehydrogenase family)
MNSSLLNNGFFSSKVYIVTGAASGIGCSVAEKLLNYGAYVIAIDRNIETLQLLYSDNPNVSSFYLDLSDPSSVDSLSVDDLLLFGKISGFVHCAGIPCALPLKVLNTENFIKTFTVNAMSGVLLFRKIANNKISSAGLSTVFISSIFSIVGTSSSVAYAMSKGAVNSAVRSLAIEYAGRHYNVNAVAPGFVRTEMFGTLKAGFDEGYEDHITTLHPLGLGEVEDVVNPVIFLLSPLAKWITGQVIAVDGGYTVQ